MEIIIDKFYNKLEKYKEEYSEKFLNLKLKKIFADESLKIEINNISKFMITMDKKILQEEIFTQEEFSYFNIMKQKFSLEKFNLFLEKNGIKSKELLKEYFFAYLGSVLIVSYFGKVKKIDLFEKIIFLWIFVDNISDNQQKYNKKDKLNNLFCFFKEKIYNKESSEVLNYFDNLKEDNLIVFIKELYEILEKDERVKFFEAAEKLLEFSYSKKGLQEEKNKKGKEILVTTILKTFFTFQLLYFILHKKDTQKNLNQVYILSLITQLADDIIDIKKDVEENSNTLITNSTKEERSIIILIIFELVITKKSSLNKFLIFSIFYGVNENKDCYEKSFFEEIKNVLGLDLYNSKFINFETFNNFII